MNRRGFLQGVAGLSAVKFPDSSLHERSEISDRDVEKVIDSLPEDRIVAVEPTNPGRGEVAFSNRVSLENVDTEVVGDGLEFAKQILDPNEDPSIEHEAFRQSVVQYIGVQERELDANIHYFGVDWPQAKVIESGIQSAFPNIDLNISSEDVTNTWPGNNYHFFGDSNNYSPFFELIFGSNYEGGLPEDRDVIESEFGDSSRVDAFIFRGDHTHGYGSPGGSASVEIGTSNDYLGDFRNVRTPIHEFGHVVYGLPHHYTKGAMSYNGSLINESAENGDGEEFLDFGSYSQPQIDRILNGSIELEQTDRGKNLVYRAEEKDPTDHSEVFLQNMKHYMERMTELTLDEYNGNAIEWTPLDAYYTEEMDIARMEFEDEVVEIAVHKDDGFAHREAYARIIN